MSINAQEKAEKCGQPFAGVVTDIQGIGTLLKRNGKSQKLTSQNAKGTRLYVGEKLRCALGAKLKVRLCSVAQEVEISNRKWYVIRVPSAMPAISEGTRRRTEALLKYFGPITGGRPRGPEDFILFPNKRSNDKRYSETKGLNTVRPDTVVFRWLPVNERLTLLLYLARSEKPIWSQDNIDGAIGSFSSNEIKDILNKLRGDKTNARIQLRIRTPRAEDSAEFEVLSLEGEKSLAQELAEWDKETDMFRHLGRAYAFSRRQLFLEAAAEYETALSTSPQNMDLLKATVSAQDRAGNLTRLKQLRAVSHF